MELTFPPPPTPQTEQCLCPWGSQLRALSSRVSASGLRHSNTAFSQAWETGAGGRGFQRGQVRPLKTHSTKRVSLRVVHGKGEPATLESPSDLPRGQPEVLLHLRLDLTSTRPPSLQNWASESADLRSLYPLKKFPFKQRDQATIYSWKPLPESGILTFKCLQKINKIKSVSFKCCWLGCHGYHLIMKDDCYLFPWKHRGWRNIL